MSPGVVLDARVAESANWEWLKPRWLGILGLKTIRRRSWLMGWGEVLFEGPYDNVASVVVLGKSSSSFLCRCISRKGLIACAIHCVDLVMWSVPNRFSLTATQSAL